MANALASGIVPAQLGFLALYNPGLGKTDETVHDQIVYFASPSTQPGPRSRRHRSAKDRRPPDAVSREERNERLRQIGLAQGMVEFGRSFSDGQAVDSIDTERSRVVLHELEPGWWVLASIDLTRLPLSPIKTPLSSATSGPGSTPSAPSPPPTPEYEYSSREVKPAVLLLQDLLRAHSLFLLHHGPSISSLFASVPRPQFTAILSRYWDLFLSTWNVLLHGNPASSVFGGTKIAACGELGMGVGEEDRGSGEREVLEGLVDRVEGLVDVAVGRFGSAQVEPRKGKGIVVKDEGWLGLGNEVGAEDGAVFLGTGALSRRSLRAVVGWMEDIYAWGEGAYGVVDKSSGTGPRTKRRRTAGKKPGAAQPPSAAGDEREQAKSNPNAVEPQTTGDVQARDQNSQSNPAVEAASVEVGAAGGGMDKMFNYLKLGYGTYWSLGTPNPSTNPGADDGPTTTNPADIAEGEAVQQSATIGRSSDGYFLIGLGEQHTEPDQPDSSGKTGPARPRTVTVELEDQVGHDRNLAGLPSPSPDTLDQNKPTTATLRPVIYVHRPFIHILLFHSDTIPPPWEAFSQTLQTQLAPLHKPLLASTAYRPEKPNLGAGPTKSPTKSEIYDLVFDPQTLTIHSTIPNIPDPPLPSLDGTLPPAPPSPQAWTRVEALNTHNQLLGMVAGTRADPSALERTCKTSRGWWVVWNRVVDPSAAAAAAAARESSRSFPGSDASDNDDDDERKGGGGAADDDGICSRRVPPVVGGKEIFLVRRASDNGGGGIRGVSASYVVGGGNGGVGGGAGGWADGASRLAQGIGVDTRRYIEGLLSLNR